LVTFQVKLLIPFGMLKQVDRNIQHGVMSLGVNSKLPVQ
jgi:hypothetical protein